MSFLKKVGSFTCPASADSSYAITGVGFEPKCVIFWTAGALSSGAIAGETSGFGVTIGTGTTNNFGIGNAERGTDSAGGEVDTARVADTNCIVVPTHSGTAPPTLTNVATLDSFDSDGFTLDFTTSTAERQVFYLAMGGDDPSFELDIFQSPTSDGDQERSEFSAEPVALLGMSALTPSLNSLAQIVTSTIGIASAAADQTAVGYTMQNTLSSESERVFDRDGFINVAFDDATLFRAEVKSFDSDGFTLDWTDSNATARDIAVLGIFGVRAKVARDSSKTSTTGTKATTGVGFEPSAALFLTSAVASGSGTTYATDLRVGIGGATGTGSTDVGSIAIGSEDGDAGPTNITRYHSSTRAITMMEENFSTPTIDAQANVDSFDNDGLTLNWTTVHASTAFEWAGLFLTAFPVIAGAATITVNSAATMTYTEGGAGGGAESITGAATITVNSAATMLFTGVGESITGAATITVNSAANMTFVPVFTVTLTGTLVNSVEADVTAGGPTLIATLADATYAATLTTAIKTDIIAGIQDRTGYLNDQQMDLVRDELLLNLANVVRTSATVVTITLPSSAYDIARNGDIELVMPGSAIA